MAIYHLEAKMVSRGAGRSAVAAAAYLSCSRMLNEYDGVQHDYTRKQGLGWRQVFCQPPPPQSGRIGKNPVERRGGNRNRKGQPPCP